MSTTEHGFEALAIGIGKKTSVAGGATAAVSGAVNGTGAGHAVAVASGVDITGICAIVGAAIAVLGFCVSVYFQLRRDRREARESNWRMGDPDRRKGSES